MKLKYILWGMILVNACLAKDFGVLGETFAILEEDLLTFITHKLDELNTNGTIKAHQNYIQQKVKQRVLEPVGTNLPETIKNKVFYYDPTIVVAEDLRDSKGKVFRRKGEKINPLDTYSFKEPWLFFDLNSLKQKKFALKELKNRKLKLILIKGRPLDLMQELKQPVYFDQFGWLIKKFNITQVPALVEQEGRKLKITEIKISKCKN